MWESLAFEAAGVRFFSSFFMTSGSNNKFFAQKGYPFLLVYSMWQIHEVPFVHHIDCSMSYRASLLSLCYYLWYFLNKIDFDNVDAHIHHTTRPGNTVKTFWWIRNEDDEFWISEEVLPMYFLKIFAKYLAALYVWMPIRFEMGRDGTLALWILGSSYKDGRYDFLGLRLLWSSLGM